MYESSHVYNFVSTVLMPIDSAIYASQVKKKLPNNSISLKELAYKTEESIVVDLENPVELSEKKDNTLSLLGMGATLILFVVILKSLFKPEKQSKEEDDRKIENEANAIEKSNNSNKSNSLVFSEFSQKSLKPNQNSNNKSNKGELVSGRQLKIAKHQDDFLLGDSLKEVSNVNRQPVSRVMGELTIVTSSTTKIDVVHELILDLQQHNNFLDLSQEKLRRKAIWELGKTNDFRALEPLIKTFSKVESLEKSLILDAIVKIVDRSYKTINNIVTIFLKDESVEVRNKATEDLENLHQAMRLVIDRLVNLTQDSDREVQQAAKWTLKKFQRISAPISLMEYSQRGK